MKQKIIEILGEMESQFETTGYYGSFAGYGVKDTDYSELADRLVKLFLTPDTGKEFCSCPNEDAYKIIEGKLKCTNCNKKG